MSLRVQKNDRTIRDKIREVKTKREDFMSTARDDQQHNSDLEAGSVGRKKSETPSLSKKRSSSIRRFFMSRSRRKDAIRDKDHDRKQLEENDAKDMIVDSDTDRNLDNEEDRLFRLIKAFQECDDDSESSEKHETRDRRDYSETMELGSRRKTEENFDSLAAQVEAFRKQIAEKATSYMNDCDEHDKEPGFSALLSYRGSDRTFSASENIQNRGEKAAVSDQLETSYSGKTHRSNGGEQIQFQKPSRSRKSSDLRKNKFKRDARQLKVDCTDEENIPLTEFEEQPGPSEQSPPTRSNRGVRPRSANLRNNKFKKDARQLLTSDCEDVEEEKTAKSSVSRHRHYEVAHVTDKVTEEILIENIPIPKTTVGDQALSQGTSLSPMQSDLGNPHSACSSHPKTEREVMETASFLKTKSKQNIADKVENSMSKKDLQLDKKQCSQGNKEWTKSNNVIHDQEPARDSYSDEEDGEYQTNSLELNLPSDKTLSLSQLLNQTRTFVDEEAPQEDPSKDYLNSCQYEENKINTFLGQGKATSTDSMNNQYNHIGILARATPPAKPPRKRKIEKLPSASEDPEVIMQSLLARDASFFKRGETVQIESEHPEENRLVSGKEQKLELPAKALVNSAAPPAKPPRKQNIEKVPSENLEAMMQYLLAREKSFLKLRRETEQKELLSTENRFDKKLNFPEILPQPPPAKSEEKDYALEIRHGGSSSSHNYTTEKTDKETEITETDEFKSKPKRRRGCHILTIVIILMILGAVTYVSIQTELREKVLKKLGLTKTRVIENVESVIEKLESDSHGETVEELETLNSIKDEVFSTHDDIEKEKVSSEVSHNHS
ncbi:hypothetical protein ACHWQZ_G005015 [Mnemiopsis leidyi]